MFNKNKNNKTRSITSFWYFYSWFWTYFAPYSSVSNVDFEQTNIGWVVLFHKVVAKTFLPYFFQANETRGMETTTDVFLMFKIECSGGIFSFK